MADLRLAKLPDRTPVKITINVSPDLNEALVAYADMYREAYGQAEPVQELVPAMLASFLESDRGVPCPTWRPGHPPRRRAGRPVADPRKLLGSISHGGYRGSRSVVRFRGGMCNDL